MERKMLWSSALSIIFLYKYLAQMLHAQPGFISINCGSTSSQPYIFHNVTYASDYGYIDTGTNMDTVSDLTFLLYNSVRSFPKGDRNCYNLSHEVQSGKKYIIRTYFHYGNYDGKSHPPQFDLYVDVNLWKNIRFDASNDYFFEEIIMVSTMDFISICLANIGTGTPFISAIELRPLDNSMYTVVNEDQYLRTHIRQYAGSSTDGLWYPTDPYDLIWYPSEFSGWSIFNETRKRVRNKDPHVIEPVSAVMEAAAFPLNTTKEASIFWHSKNSSSQYHLYMHFAELEALDSNMTREFYVCCNGWCSNTIRPEYLSTTTVSNEVPIGIPFDKELRCTFTRTQRSTHPPILNAIQLLYILPLTTKPTKLQDVKGLLDMKATYGVKRNWVGDPCVPRKYSWEGVTCSYPERDSPKITSLNFSSYGLEGKIADSIFALKSITSLDLSGNNLTGSVPEFFGKLLHLTYLDLSRNNLTGHVPNFLWELPQLQFLNLCGNRFIGVLPNNSHEKDFGSYSNSCSFSSFGKNRHSKKFKAKLPVLGTTTSVGFLFIISLLAWIASKWRRQGLANDNGIKTVDMLPSRCQQFTYAEVVAMTENFKRMMGKGGFGSVFHGQMGDGKEIAVKVLSPISVQLIDQKWQGSEEFYNEAQLLARAHHRNLITFIGYCKEGDKMALVYEYMAHGDLESHLSGAKNSELLCWRHRMQIALNVAQGLDYLHNGCTPSIIHRDLKTSNILLNERFEAKIGDFGLSKILIEDGQTHISTIVKGTRGYLDPEYYLSNNLTQKSDVYSFGVVLLELITGLPAIIHGPDHQNITLVNWASPTITSGDIQSVVDAGLKGNYDIDSLWIIAEIALACTSARAMERPSISEVAIQLKDCVCNKIINEMDESLMIISPLEMTSSSFSQPKAR